MDKLNTFNTGSCAAFDTVDHSSHCKHSWLFNFLALNCSASPTTFLATIHITLFCAATELGSKLSNFSLVSQHHGITILNSELLHSWVCPAPLP